MYPTGLPKNMESWKNLEFDNLGKKKTGILNKTKLKKPCIFNNFNMLNIKILTEHEKSTKQMKFFCYHQFFLN